MAVATVCTGQVSAAGSGAEVPSAAGYAGRLAPSPTGLLHMGHARTFMVAWQRARAAGGVLWLRDDDLDRDRVQPAYAAAMREDLRWLGLTWDAEVRQSERLPLYRAALEQLLAMGLAYPCDCSRRELAAAVSAPHETDDEPVYSGRCRHRATPATAFAPGVNYRFRVPDGEAVNFSDALAGPQSFTAGCGAGADFGDFVVWRRATPSLAADACFTDGLPSYQLATVVDDAAMGITEVVRGRDLLRSTARQIVLARALGRVPPAWCHVELVRDAAGQRLAKRHDALSVRALRERGVKPAELLRDAEHPGTLSFS